MNFTEKDIALFDEYLKGNLSEQEKTAFEQKLVTDEEFKRDFEMYSTLVDGIRTHAREELKRKIAKEGEVKYIQNIWGKKGTMAAAAVLIFFLGLYFVFESNLGKKLLPSQDSQPAIAMEDNPVSEPPKKQRKLTPKNQDTEIADDTLNPQLAIQEDDSLQEDNLSEEQIDENTIAATQDINDSATADIASGGALSKSAGFAAPVPAHTEQEEEQIVSGQLLLDTVFNALKITSEPLTDNDIKGEEEYIHVNMQIWKSPLNSKVGKFVITGNSATAEIYGLIPSEIRAVFVNEQRELIVLGNKQAYIIKPARDYQPYKTSRETSFINELIHLNEN
jgi:hypothetical protein